MDGVSLANSSESIFATPFTPKNVHVSSKRAHSLIKIQWSSPDSSLITHYEIASEIQKN